MKPQWSPMLIQQTSCMPLLPACTCVLEGLIALGVAQAAQHHGLLRHLPPLAQPAPGGTLDIVSAFHSYGAGAIEILHELMISTGVKAMQKLCMAYHDVA